VSNRNSIEDIPEEYTVEDRSPQDIIEDYLELKLPDSANIIEFSYPSEYGHFSGKIQIDEENINDIEMQLSSFLWKYDSEHIGFFPDVSGVYPWWDMKKEDIISVYGDFIDYYINDHMLSTEAWTFIIKDQYDNYYLYIVF